MKKRYKIIIVLIVLLAGCLAKNTLDICIFSMKDEKCRADVAIILGAATYNGQVSPVYKERMNHGIALYREGYVDKLIVTGGLGAGNKESDAETAKSYAMEQGVPEEDILVEGNSFITQENLENSKNIMDEHRYRTAIIVSDPLHMKRALLLAGDAGIPAYSSPTPTSKYVSLKTKLPFLAREVFYYTGYKWYRLFR